MRMYNCIEIPKWNVKKNERLAVFRFKVADCDLKAAAEKGLRISFLVDCIDEAALF